MTDRPRTLSAAELRAWTLDLDQRENELADERAAFAFEQADFEAKAERWAASRTGDIDIDAAIRLIRRLYPEGVTFAPRSGRSNAPRKGAI